MLPSLSPCPGTTRFKRFKMAPMPDEETRPKMNKDDEVCAVCIRSGRKKLIEDIVKMIQKTLQKTQARSTSRRLPTCPDGINVTFVSSVPGSNKDGSMCLWGHRAVAKLLRTHVSSHVSSWLVVAQCYSIGSLGFSSDTWLETELGRSLASVRPGPGGPLAQPTCRPHVSLIYPSHADVLDMSEVVTIKRADFGGER